MSSGKNNAPHGRLATPYGDIDLGQQWLEGTGLSAGTKPLPESKLADRQCVLWYSHEGNFPESNHGINLLGEIKIFWKITATTQRDQWILKLHKIVDNQWKYEGHIYDLVLCRGFIVWCRPFNINPYGLIPCYYGILRFYPASVEQSWVICLNKLNKSTDHWWCNIRKALQKLVYFLHMCGIYCKWNNETLWLVRPTIQNPGAVIKVVHVWSAAGTTYRETHADKP